jgi:hypothetical protein
MTEQQAKAACERIMRIPGRLALTEDLDKEYRLLMSEMFETLVELEKCLSNADDRPYERELIKKVLDKATKP